MTRHITNWNGVLENVRKDDENKSDALVWTSEILVEKGHLIIPTKYVKSFTSDFRNGHKTNVVAPAFENGNVVLTLSDRAITQMCGRLNIPPRYLKRKMTEAAWHVVDPVIRDDLEKHGDRVLLRLKGTTVRAVLSKKYTRLNNVDIFEDLAALVAERTEIRSMHLDSDGVWIKALFEGLDFVGADGVKYHVGMMIGNSEVGHRSVTVEPFIYRLSCTNDLVVVQDDRFRQRHIYIDRAQLRLGLRKAIALAVRAGDEMADQIELAINETIEDPLAVIEKVAKKARYSQKFTDEVKERWEDERRENKWGVVNAFTAAAQTLEGDRRVDVERMAGNLLVAPDLTRAKVPAPVTTDLN
jgi:hypothetical protein